MESFAILSFEDGKPCEGDKILQVSFDVFLKVLNSISRAHNRAHDFMTLNLLLYFRFFCL